MCLPKVLILIVFATLVNSEEICEPPLKTHLTVYHEIDSASENVTLEGRLQYKKDLFHLLIANEVIPQLCKNYVFIQNELSVLQIVNSSVQKFQPGAFNITPTLALLRIVFNNIATVEKNVFNSVKVKEIDLSDNRITSIDPEAFDNNTHLQVLKLNNNQIRELNSNWFGNSPNVYKLSIIYNDIKSVPDEAFKNMAQNRPLKLRLSTNRITEISPNALNTHKTIQLLRLNGNKLTSLPESLFVNRTIENLQINFNNLRCFPEALFNASIDTLAFTDNLFFECDCLKKVKKFSDERKIDVIYPSVICEDRSREVNIVFNYNKTYEIPLMSSSVDVDVYAKPDQDAF